MFPPVFPLLNIPAIRALVGADPVRIYDFDSAPQGVTTPYITWFVVSGNPESQISGSPCVDFDTVQIDIYTGPADDGADQAGALALAVRGALDAAGHANRLIINHREADTKLFRVSIEADIITSR